MSTAAAAADAAGCIMGHEFTAKVRYSEVDEHELLTITHVLDLFQDCVVFHSDAAGVPMDYWRRRDVFWVITSWKLLIARRPKLSEMITVRTDATAFKGFRGRRNFTIRDMQGNILIAADSSWALLDYTRGGMPAKILPEEAEAYGLAEPLPMREERERIGIPPVSGDPIVVMQYHLDTNHHMNNAHFLQTAMSYLPDGFEPRTVRIAYHRQAVEGDMLYPAFAMEEHRMYGAFVNEENEPYALLMLSDSVAEEDARVFEAGSGS